MSDANTTPEGAQGEAEQFCHLHVHSEYSSLDGACKIKDLVALAAERGHTHVGLSDHGTMSGLPSFYKAAKGAGLTAVLGVELYLTPDRHAKEKGTQTWHLGLIARTTEGYENLCRITSRAYLEGWGGNTGIFARPRADWEVLGDHSQGIIALTGCMAAPVMSAIFQGDLTAARANTERLIEIFGRDNVYGEIQNVGIVEQIPADSELAHKLGKFTLSQTEANRELAVICESLGIPLVGTGDVHYLRAEDAVPHDALLCVGTGQLQSRTAGGEVDLEPERAASDGRFRRKFSLLPKKYYFRSEAEMREALPEWPEALANAKALAERCDAHIPEERQMLPAYPVPSEHDDAKTYLRHLCEQGMVERYGPREEQSPEHRERLEFELGVIDRMGFNDYFLIVWDFVNEAARRGIPAGPGRGCLDGDTRIWTEDGYVPIREVTPGTVVMTHSGRRAPVKHRHTYPGTEGEALLKIRTSYDDAAGVTLTPDHKVLVVRDEGPQEGEWIRADEIRRGDSLVVPRSAGRASSQPPASIDLAEFISAGEHSPGVTIMITDTEIVEHRVRFRPYPSSSHDLSRRYRISRRSILEVRQGRASAALVEKLERIVRSEGFASLSEWEAYCGANQITELRFPRRVKCDHDFWFLLGLMCSDGFLARDHDVLGWVERASTSDGSVAARIARVWPGLPMRSLRHATSDVVSHRFASAVVWALYRGLAPGYEHTAHTKQLPEWICGLDETARRAVLAGLWSGDGHEARNTGYSTTSCRLAAQVRNLLWGLGVPASLRLQARWGKSGYANARPIYRIGVPHHWRPPRRAFASVTDERILLRVQSIDDAGPRDWVYDLEVDSADHSYLTSSFVVHNSAAGSLVSYALGVTQLDPLKFGLLFERFLNPDRVSMPDIDWDVSITRRGEMVEYVRDKYNALAGCETAVSQIITHGMIGAKAGLRDAGRVLDKPLSLVNRLAKLVPDKPVGMSLRDVYKNVPAFRSAFENDPDARELITLAGWLEGFVRNEGIHAAGVVIWDRPLETAMPIQRKGPNAPLTTSYEMKHVEAAGALKMDFLGLRNLDIVWRAIEIIKYTEGVELDPYDIPLDDAGTYGMLARGEAIGVFQFESSGMRSALQQVGPTEFNDLIALVALYRPGPMEYIPTYAARKHGREKTVYLDPRLEAITGETYAVTVYQEQSMTIAKELAGFTPGEADTLRKAIGKKNMELMQSLKPQFVAGCVANGVPKAVAEQLWADNEKAADYSFNKSHAACYGYIAYVTAYLKHNHPAAYMAALISLNAATKDKVPFFITEARRMGLRVLPPDVNRSLRDFAVMEVEERAEGDPRFEILFGLSAIKGVGEGVISDLRSERERNGPFRSVFDLIRRCPQLSKAVVELLVRSGALDCTGASRKAMLEAVAPAKEAEAKRAKQAEKDFAAKVLEEALTRLHPVAAEAEAPAASTMSAAATLFDVAVDTAPTPARKASTAKKAKLSTDQKRALEAVAKLAHTSGATPSEAEARAAARKALDAEALRKIRAALRKESALILDAEVLESKATERMAEEAEARASAAIELAGIGVASVTAVREAAAEDFDLDAALAESFEDPQLIDEDWPELERLNEERKVLGLYASGHPLDGSKREWRRYISHTLGSLGGGHIGQVVTVVGVITSARELKKKTGESFGWEYTLDDLTGSRPVTFFNDALDDMTEGLLVNGGLCVIKAKVQEDSFQARKNEEASEEETGDPDQKPVKLNGLSVHPWRPEQVSLEPIRPLEVNLPPERRTPQTVAQLKDILEAHPGRSPVVLILDGARHELRERVELNPTLMREVAALAGVTEPAAA